MRQICQPHPQHMYWQVLLGVWLCLPVLNGEVETFSFQDHTAMCVYRLCFDCTLLFAGCCLLACAGLQLVGGQNTVEVSFDKVLRAM